MKKKLTQSQIKERQEKTKKIKSLLIRSLNIVCYCLSVLFIIMAIAIGAQSCSNKNKSETESAAISPSNKIQLRLDNQDFDISQYSYFYSSAFTTGTISITETEIQHFNAEFDLESMIVSTAQPSDSYRYVYPNNCWMMEGENHYQINYFRCRFSTLEYQSGIWFRFLLNFMAYDVDGVSHQISYEMSFDGQDTYTYKIDGDFKFFFADERLTSTTFNYFFNEYEINPLSFTFNNQINYNATFGGNIDEPFLSNGTTTSIDIGWFWSGGKLWDSINFVWIDATNSSFKLSDDSIYEVTSSGYKYFLYMSYENSLTNASVMVNSRDSLSYTSGNALSYYVNNSSTWVSSNYQTIILLTDTSELNITYLNKYNNTTAGGSITTGCNIGLQNGFTLLGSAFSSILPFLAIQVLPGLSIGLLLFIPLIVIIIVLVFKVVKK